VRNIKLYFNQFQYIIGHKSNEVMLKLGYLSIVSYDGCPFEDARNIVTQAPFLFIDVFYM